MPGLVSLSPFITKDYSDSGTLVTIVIERCGYPFISLNLSNYYREGIVVFNIKNYSHSTVVLTGDSLKKIPNLRFKGFVLHNVYLYEDRNLDEPIKIGGVDFYFDTYDERFDSMINRFDINILTYDN